MGEGAYENGGLLKWRVNSNTTRIEEIERRLRDIDIERATVGEKLAGILEDVREIRAELKGFRRMMFIGILTAAGSSLTFAFTVLAGTGRI